MHATQTSVVQPLQPVDRHTEVKQYSLRQILAVWAAAALPMGVLAWVGAPLLRDQLCGPLHADVQAVRRRPRDGHPD
jgi:lipoate synthase